MSFAIPATMFADNRCAFGGSSLFRRTGSAGRSPCALARLRFQLARRHTYRRAFAGGSSGLELSTLVFTPNKTPVSANDVSELRDCFGGYETPRIMMGRVLL